jgi:hypothetical protein
MTREEAVAKCKGIAELYRLDAFGHAHAFVDLFAQLGMLDLDEPKREGVLRRARKYREAGGMIEVSADSLCEAVRLICEMADELEKQRS